MEELFGFKETYDGLLDTADNHTIPILQDFPQPFRNNFRTILRDMKN